MLVQLCNHELNPIHYGGGRITQIPQNRTLSLEKLYWLFLSLRSRIRQVLDYSPIDRERDLGLDRSETGFIGSYYVSLYLCNLKS